MAQPIDLLDDLDLARPIPGCVFIDPADGTCGHPDAITPECWRLDGLTADCPPLDRIVVTDPDDVIKGPCRYPRLTAGWVLVACGACVGCVSC